MTENQHEPSNEHSENDSILGDQSTEYQSAINHQSGDKMDQTTGEFTTDGNKIKRGVWCKRTIIFCIYNNFSYAQFAGSTEDQDEPSDAEQSENDSDTSGDQSTEYKSAEVSGFINTVLSWMKK